MSEFKFKEIFHFCERHSGSVEGQYVELQTTDLLFFNRMSPYFVHLTLL